MPLSSKAMNFNSQDLISRYFEIKNTETFSDTSYKMIFYGVIKRVGKISQKIGIYSTKKLTNKLIRPFE